METITSIFTCNFHCILLCIYKCPTII